LEHCSEGVGGRLNLVGIMMPEKGLLVSSKGKIVALAIRIWGKGRDGMTTLQREGKSLIGAGKKKKKKSQEAVIL